MEDVNGNYNFDLYFAELFVDGSTFASVAELSNCDDFYYLPVLRDYKIRDNLFLARGSGKISFFTYNATTNQVAKASAPLTAKDLKTLVNDACTS